MLPWPGNPAPENTTGRLQPTIGIEYAAAIDFVTVFEHDSNGFGIDSVFLLQDARGKRVLCVLVFYGDDGLQNNRAGVEIFVDKMDGAAGELDAVFESLALRLEARKRGQQGRVNIQDAVGERGYKIRGQQAHVAGEADEIDFVILKRGYNFAVVLLAWLTFRWNYERVQASMARGFQAGSVGAVRNHGGNAGVGYTACCQAVGDGDKIGAAAGEENAEILHRSIVVSVRGRLERGVAVTV